MKATIAIRPAAARDIAEAYDWYEAQEPGLGGRFLNMIERSLKLIAERPEGWPTVVRDARRALVSRFPYSIYYRLCDAEVRILAVVHQSRHPKAWRRRVTGR